jgi:mycofactocin precursor
VPPVIEEDAMTAPEHNSQQSVEIAENEDQQLIVEDLVVEEVSIDGMCGVY